METNRTEGYIERLDFSGDVSCDLTQITRCANLKELRVNGCNISDFSQLNLEYTPELRVLEARDNMIHSFESMPSLQALEMMDVRGNPLSQDSLETQFGIFPSLRRLMFGGRVGCLQVFRRLFLDSTPMPIFFNSVAFSEAEFSADMSRVGSRGSLELKLKQSQKRQTKNSALLVEVFQISMGEVRLLAKRRAHLADSVNGFKLEFDHGPMRYVALSVCFRGSRAVCLYVLANTYSQVDYNIELARCLQLTDEKPQSLLESKFLNQSRRSRSTSPALNTSRYGASRKSAFGVLQSGQVIPFQVPGASVLDFYQTQHSRKQILQVLGDQLRAQHGLQLPPDELQRILGEAIRRCNTEVNQRTETLPDYILLDTQFGSIMHPFRVYLNKLYPRPDGRTTCGKMDYYIAAYYRAGTGSLQFQISEQPIQKQAEEFELRVVDCPDRVEAWVYRQDGRQFGDIAGTTFTFFRDSHTIQKGPQNVWIKDGRQGVIWATWESPWCEIDSNRVAVEGFAAQSQPSIVSERIRALPQKAEVFRAGGVVMTPLVQKVLGQSAATPQPPLTDPQYQSYKDAIVKQSRPASGRSMAFSAIASSQPLLQSSTNVFSMRKSVGLQEKSPEVWNPASGTRSVVGKSSKIEEESHSQHEEEAPQPRSPPVLVKKQTAPRQEETLRSPTLQLVTVDPVTGNRAVKDYVPTWQSPGPARVSDTPAFLHQNGLTYSPRLPQQAIQSVQSVSTALQGSVAKTMVDVQRTYQENPKGSQYAFQEPQKMDTIRLNGRLSGSVVGPMSTQQQARYEEEIRKKNPDAMQPLQQLGKVEAPRPSGYRVDLPQHGDRRLIRQQQLEPWVWPEGFVPPCLYTLWTPSRELGEPCIIRLQKCVSRNQPQLRVFSRELCLPFQTGLRPSNAMVRVEPLEDGWAVHIKFCLTDLGKIMYLMAHFEQDVEILVQLTETPVYGPQAVADVHEQLLNDAEAAIDCYQLDFAAQKAIPSSFLLNPRVQKITLTQQRAQAVFDGALTDIILPDKFALRYNSLLLDTGLRKYCYELVDTLINRELLQRFFQTFLVFEPQRELQALGLQAYKRMGLEYSSDLVERMAVVNDQGTLNMFLFETKEKRDRFFVKAKTACGAHLPRELYVPLPLLNFKKCAGSRDYVTRLRQLYQPVPSSITSAQLMETSHLWPHAIVLDGYQIHVQQTLTQYLQLFDSYNGYPAVLINRLQAGQTIIKTARLGLPDAPQQDFTCTAYRYGSMLPAIIRVGVQDMTIKTQRWSGRVPLGTLQTFVYNGGLIAVGSGVETRLDFADAWAMEETLRAITLRQRELLKMIK